MTIYEELSSLPYDEAVARLQTLDGDLRKAFIMEARNNIATASDSTLKLAAQALRIDRERPRKGGGKTKSSTTAQKPGLTLADL